MKKILLFLNNTADFVVIVSAVVESYLHDSLQNHVSFKYLHDLAGTALTCSLYSVYLACSVSLDFLLSLNISIGLKYI